MSLRDTPEEAPTGPLYSIAENQSGQPFNEWIVTTGGTVEGWWGEGYVIRTVKPFLVYKWGFTTQNENSAMSGGFGFSDGSFLSVLLVNQSSRSDAGKFSAQAVHAALQKLEQLGREDD
jgi:hypothetical protein